MTGNIQLCRSYQTTPAATAGDNSAKYLESAAQQEGLEIPDWFSPDLEDSTPPGMKEEARQNLINFIHENPGFKGEIRPRINWAYYDVDEGTNIDNIKELGQREINELIQKVGDDIDGFVIPKIGRVDNAKQAEEIISKAEREYGYPENTFEMCPIIETTKAISDLREVALFGMSKQRITGLIWGPGDYTFDIGGRMEGSIFPDWLSIKEKISNEASANDLLSVGGPFPEIYGEQGGKRYYNGDGYAEYVRQEVEIGFDGSWSLHPNQTVQANRLHAPSEEDLGEIIRRINIYNEKEGAGSLLVDGQLIDVGMLKHYMRKLQKAVAICDKYENQAEELYSQEIIDKANSIVQSGL